MQIEAPISLGELVDKITILEIKRERITGPAKLSNVNREYTVLTERLSQLLDPNGHKLLDPLKAQLLQINTELWEVEDKLRDHERVKDFGEQFVSLARAVYHTNDRRAAVKKDINLNFGSDLIEEKSYQPYQ